MSSSWQELQDRGHGAGHDYEPGSPHLRHWSLRDRLSAEIRAAVQRSFARSGACRVLEIGGGHGTVTDVALSAGAAVTVTEMSRSSVAVLQQKYRDNDRADVVHDPDGQSILRVGSRYDVVLFVSVLHHIPDYLGYVKDLLGILSPGGDLISFQDPLWYPRQSRTRLALHWSCYFAWRVLQGNIWRGVKTRVRHARGVLDEQLESDMVEYHVVRDGVDEEALAGLLKREFASTRLDRYWSTQSPVLQSLGERLDVPNTFALVAQGHHRPPGDVGA
ncbi:Methyltransferase domain-containing protein [Actinopolymorpha cephalotaxi]|uniref:Methyltransferase domain-containing protein n=1 Tax=Actinopolymorpha cephalotaxi TaxID=504797 RepID=A0A1I2TAS7_9ACTN|nr:class I SAM-dependent methyltransferase [Actinopolymorpha cephalotaxi]NYH82973.1 SAM-dependent methyltransferase [Actinopolymorpha cephalotaxi]SFG61219.1 Methyltransferase domain-containing protein [Actinopolymorpha cephalotaxi]